jgi:hypothetical protein
MLNFLLVGTLAGALGNAHGALASGVLQPREATVVPLIKVVFKLPLCCERCPKWARNSPDKHPRI